ncbi:cytochrome c oxidase assembly factor 4 homolog, mitochondrial [Pelobates fuscus]|uniref:cytochrome c oxidase assembly factor 4 homolog, mitochondrial n=1 Tax=Pelobates fuscus TaxID=191477 RepID=UPI002FE44DBD
MSFPVQQPHNRTRKPDDEEDPVDQMIVRTGCAAAHYAVQECMAEHQDWRQCQTQVQQFKDCMLDYQKQRAEELKKQIKAS